MSLLDRLRFIQCVRQASDVPGWSSPRLLRVQRQRLERLLKTAVTKSPFYRRKFGALDVSRIALDQLPSTSKEELRENFDGVVTDPRLNQHELQQFVADDRHLGQWYLEKYAVCQTSGSQGSPLLIVQDRRCLEVIFSLMTSRSNAHGPPSIPEAIRRLWSPKRIAAISFRRGFYPSGMTLEFLPEFLGPFTKMMRLSTQQPDLVERLNQFQPHVITGYASVLEALALQPERLRLPSLESLTNSSEFLSARAHLRIEQAFGVPVFDHYGTGECLQLADGCRKCQRPHVNADWAILEVVDEKSRPVPPGTLGAKILVTNLANEIQPFIRYEVGDRVAISAASGCPTNSLPQIGQVDGRSVEVFWVRDNDQDRFLSGILFHSAADSLNLIREWRAIQRERNRIEMQVELLPGNTVSAAEIAQSLQARLIEYGLPVSVKLEVRVVESLRPDERTGKMRRLVREVAPPE